MGILKYTTPKALTGRPTPAGASERAMVDWMLAARKRPERPDPLAAKGAVPRSSSVAGHAKRADRATDGDATAPRIRAFERRRGVCPQRACEPSRQRAAAVGCSVDRVAVGPPPGCSAGFMSMAPDQRHERRYLRILSSDLHLNHRVKIRQSNSRRDAEGTPVSHHSTASKRDRPQHFD